MNRRSALLRLARLGLVCGLLFPALGAAQPAPPPKAEKVYIPYRITRGDVVSVGVLDEPNLTAPQRRVESSGTINLVYIGDTRLVGLTINEAQEAIARAYREGRFLRNPVVTVTIETYAPRVVSISGKVNSSGRFEIPPDTEMTIIDLIFKANGLGETARGSAVRVTRTMPDGSIKLFTLDVESAIKGKNSKPSGDAAFVLEPDDIVYVPERII
jgi:polysaccharide export outer membrane protein